MGLGENVGWASDGTIVNCRKPRALGTFSTHFRLAWREIHLPGVILEHVCHPTDVAAPWRPPHEFFFARSSATRKDVLGKTLSKALSYLHFPFFQFTFSFSSCHGREGRRKLWLLQ